MANLELLVLVSMPLVRCALFNHIYCTLQQNSRQNYHSTIFLGNFNSHKSNPPLFKWKIGAQETIFCHGARAGIRTWPTG